MRFFLALLLLNGLCTCALAPYSVGVRAQTLFREISVQTGLGDMKGYNYALAVADIDGDGDEDLFASRNVGANVMFINDGNGNFTDVTAAVGLAAAADLSTYNAVFGDLDNDGDPDLYLGHRQANDQLFRNDNGVFTEITTLAGIANPGDPRSVNFADVNQDGHLDIYVVNFLSNNQLYRSNGDLTFTEIAASAGTTDARNRLGMAALFLDYDLDGDEDLYLVHDGYQANVLLQNDGGGNFRNVSRISNTDVASNGMGVATGDLNADGLPDLYVTNLGHNVLYFNNGDGTFTDVTDSAGVDDVGMGWGTSVFDYDNDGHQDIYVVNDSYFSPFPNVLYRNNGVGSFENVAEITSEGSPYGGLSCLAPDLNRDGKLDLLVGNSGPAGPLQQFRNDGATGHWLRIKLTGVVGNRDAVGASISLHAGGRTQLRLVNAGSGYAGQESYWQHFGLGEIKTVDSLTIEWPGGAVERLLVTGIDQALTIVEGQGIVSGNEVVSSTNQPSASALVAYPNPVTGRLRLRHQKITYQYCLTDAAGRTLRSGEWPVGAALDLEDLPAGWYQIRLSGKGKPSRILSVRKI